MYLPIKEKFKFHYSVQLVPGIINILIITIVLLILIFLGVCFRFEIGSMGGALQKWRKRVSIVNWVMLLQRDQTTQTLRPIGHRTAFAKEQSPYRTVCY